MRTLLPCLLLGALSLPALGLAQARPDLPERARIRIAVFRADSVGGVRDSLRGTGTVHRVGADSITFRLDESGELWIAPWARVHTLEVSEGMRAYTIGEHLGSTAILTLVGAGLGSLYWHDCKEAEARDVDVFVCMVVPPRRLGGAVRTGAWAGLAIGLIDNLVNRKVEVWRRVHRPNDASPVLGPLLSHSTRSGVMLGINIRF
jgi:hypothetical protein